MFADANSPAQVKGFYTPPPKWHSTTPKRWMSENKITSSPSKPDFHVVHKIPAGDSPYVLAKRVQLIEKDPGRAVSLFWGAINSGDRVDSALKDMAVVMKQLDRSDEAIEAIKSFRHLCSPASQESLDNVLVELYKRSGRLEEQIHILQHKLKLVEEGNAFGGKRLKLARSQGKKVHITVEQEYARLLGNLAWAYLQQNDYKTAEEYYRKALSIEVDRNKQCNLAICLMYMNRIIEARFLLRVIRDSAPEGQMDESYAKSYERASQLLSEMESQPVQSSSEQHEKENHPGRTCFSGFSPYKMPYDYGYGAEIQTNNQNGIGGGYTWKTTSTPPVRARGLPRSPFTQPRRGSMLLDRGNWSDKGMCWNEPINRSNRKLQFEKPTESIAIQELDTSVPDIQKQNNISTTDSSPNKLITSKTNGARTSEVSGAENNQNEQDFPIYKGKKSWADMVEEDEQELVNDLIIGENLDLNMIVPTKSPRSPVENLSDKFQSFGLVDQPSARRSLVFTPEQKQDTLKSKTGTRLKVFQDITPSP